MMKQPVRTSMSDFIKTTMGSQFVIPVYQRNYTWNPEVETRRFCDDMEDLLNGTTQSHFLGILIYMESEIARMFKQIQIVDGQQRLTTSFIFLLGLKQVALAKKETEIVGMIEDYYLVNRHVNEQAKLRLKPTVSDDDVYGKLVYGSVKDLTRKEKDSSVYRNYDYMMRRIEDFEKKYSLLEILDTLSRMDLLVFPLSDRDNAQQIFESINSTGAPLTAADLIRNYVLMNDTNDVQERNYKMYWKPLESYFLESRKLEEFFRYFLAAKTCNLMNRRDVYEGFKDYWNSQDLTKEDRMREIYRYCRYYHSIFLGPCEEIEVEEVLKDFRKSVSTLTAPFILEIYRMHEEGEISRTTLIQVIRLLDTYLMRRALCGFEIGSLNRYFPQLLRSVKNTWKKTHADLYEITKMSLVNYNRGKALAMPTDDALRTQLKEINAYSLLCIRPVLERIEHAGATAEVDTANLNIEHIMPQHPNGYWKKVANVKDNDEYAFYANLIGNLTLCAQYDNTRMGNSDFTTKKQVLSKTLHIRMNTEILNQTTWSPTEILKRCDSLCDTILAMFPYEESEEMFVETKDDDMLVLTAPSVNAKAIYLNPHEIDILSGSTMRAYGPQEMKSMQGTYKLFSSDGTLSEDENGQILFNKNARFSDLNTAAQFLLHRGGDNRSAWSREDGSAFVESEMILSDAQKNVSNLTKRMPVVPVEEVPHTTPKQEAVKSNTEPSKKHHRRKRNSHNRNTAKPNQSVAKPNQSVAKPPVAQAAKKPSQSPAAKATSSKSTKPNHPQTKSVSKAPKTTAKPNPPKAKQPVVSKPVAPKPTGKPTHKPTGKPNSQSGNRSKGGYMRRPKSNIAPQKEPAVTSPTTGNLFTRYLKKD